MSTPANAYALAAPGLLHGDYPERRAKAPERLSFNRPGTRFLRSQWLLTRRLRAFVAAAGGLESEYAGLTTRALRERSTTLRASLSRDALTEPLLAQAFALVRETAHRQLGVRPFDTQLFAARAMLDNQLAEMATGEGKTLAAAICAAAAALAGIPVHVLTVNDYLVARDANLMRPLYTALGLTVGDVVAAQDPGARRQSYACDITYCTAKELVFDYLRDRILRGPRRSELQASAARFAASAAPTPRPLLRGLCMAVVDEADSILIDEARVPLILSRSAVDGGERDYHARALELARQLRVGVDYTLDRPRRGARLTDAGTGKLERLSIDLPAVWHNQTHREETVCMALVAQHLYRRDHDYLVQEDSVVVVDGATGRVAPGRVWSRGLHQLIALKEGCKPAAQQVTVAQITYQRFFTRYLRLGGMSGTLAEARAELSAVYQLDVVKVPLRRPLRRALLPTRLLRDRDAVWRAVTEQALELSRAGRPVLIGTDSVADSESLSATLTSAGLVHQVLNARYDRQEAEIVAAAGGSGCITVATNMAGRGTDILLARDVADRGGLHVICCQHNASHRLDRQLIGRCARQGDPGSAETIVALEKSPVACLVPTWLLRRVGINGLSRPRWFVALALQLPQWLEESRQRDQRRALQRQDERAERELFAGVDTE